MAAPDYRAAAGWYKLSANAGYGKAANNLSMMYQTGSGVTRSKQMARRWRRKAAENGHVASCKILAAEMYAVGPGGHSIALP